MPHPSSSTAAADEDENEEEKAGSTVPWRGLEGDARKSAKAGVTFQRTGTSVVSCRKGEGCSISLVCNKQDEMTAASEGPVS
jgi:hypothetical protein